MVYREMFAKAVENMLDEGWHVCHRGSAGTIYGLCKKTGIARSTIYKLIKMEKPQVRIDVLYKLIERGLEINCTELLLNRIKREKGTAYLILNGGVQ